MARSHDELPADLQGVADALDHGRPQLTELELDRIKRHAMVRGARKATAGTTTGRGIIMRSRLAITSMLVAGLVMSGSGATLAVTGLTDTNSAGVAQYGAGKPQETTLGGVAGQQAQGEPEGLGGVAGEQVTGEPGGVAGEQVAGDNTTPEATVQAPRQLESVSGGELPFTGYLGIPILLGGVALLITGLVLRRRTALDA